MNRSYSYRIYPTKDQEQKLLNQFDLLREVWNAALQERRDAYKKQRISVSKYDQTLQLKEVRKARPDFDQILNQTVYEIIFRLDKALQRFFERCKLKKKLIASGQIKLAKKIKVGYPRFKSKKRFKSYVIPAVNKKKWLVQDNRRLDIPKIGLVKIVHHQPYQGTLKNVSIKRESDGTWYAIFNCDNVPTQPLPKTGLEVGIDLGLSKFATLSNGEVIENPRFLKKAAAGLRKAAKRLSRRQLGSNRRNKARVLLAKKYAKLGRVRKDFQHKLSRDLVNRFDKIVIEDLNVGGLAKSKLAKSVNDVSWASFIFKLTYKAESAGRQLLKVDPSYTSQDCSNCGERVPKSLKERRHICPSCNLNIDRDLNAALNIFKRSKSDLRGDPGNSSAAKPPKKPGSLKREINQTEKVC